MPLSKARQERYGKRKRTHVITRRENSADYALIKSVMRLKIRSFLYRICLALIPPAYSVILSLLNMVCMELGKTNGLSVRIGARAILPICPVVRGTEEKANGWTIIIQIGLLAKPKGCPLLSWRITDI